MWLVKLKRSFKWLNVYNTKIFQISNNILLDDYFDFILLQWRLLDACSVLRLGLFCTKFKFFLQISSFAKSNVNINLKTFLMFVGVNGHL